MIRSVIIDDERHSIETLRWKVERCCPEVQIVETFLDPVAGLSYLRRDPPDLLFLDIAMPVLTGFDLLEQIGDVPFGVIFTTAHDDFGIQAIKFSALDYLLKPVQNQELQEAITRFQEKQRSHLLSARQLEILLTNMREEEQGLPGKIALPTKESIEFVDAFDIVICSSDSNYTMVHLAGNRKRLISRTLREFDEMLTPHHFFRVHHSHLINLNHIREYVRSDGGYLIMSNQMRVPVSRQKREELLGLF